MDKSKPYLGFSIMAWVWALLLVIAPLAYILFISFLTRNNYGGFDFTLSLASYKKLMNPEYGLTILSSLIRSISLALLTTVACILVGFPVALYLVFVAGPLRPILFFLLIIPFWTNFLIRTYAWMVLLSDNGWINHVLENFGLPPQYLHWLFTPKAVFIGMFYNYLPYMAMSLYVNIEKIDVKLLEAAADLGASRLKRFFKIILPLCLPGLAAGSLIVFIPALGEFVIPDILGGGTNLYIGNLLSQQFLTVRNWPLGSAMSVVLIFLISVCLWVFNRIKKDDSEALLA